jgi:hypothetical protein
VLLNCSCCCHPALAPHRPARAVAAAAAHAAAVACTVASCCPLLLPPTAETPHRRLETAAAAQQLILQKQHKAVHSRINSVSYNRCCRRLSHLSCKECSGTEKGSMRSR